MTCPSTAKLSWISIHNLIIIIGKLLLFYPIVLLTLEHPCKEGQLDVVKMIQDFLYHFECLRCEWNDSFRFWLEWGAIMYSVPTLAL